MKIGISATGKDKDSLMDMRFGRCEYFQIYDTQNEEVKIIENKAQSASGGAGIAAAQQLIDEKVDIIITGNLGPNAFKVIGKAGVKPYKCERMSICSAVEKYNKGDLLELTQAGPAHHGMGQ
jgi:predicted Fe-Mo cluster-binding NifX family protein